MKFYNNALRTVRILNKQQKIKGLILAFLLCIGAAFEALGVSLIAPILDLVIGGNNSYDNIFSRFIGSMNLIIPTDRLVVFWILILVFVFITKGLFLSVLLWITAKYTFKIKAEISNDMMQRYLNAPYEFHSDQNSAQLIRNLITEADHFRGKALLQVLIIGTEILVFLLIMSVLLIIEPLGTIIGSIILAVSMYAFQKTIGKYSAKIGKLRQNADGLVLKSAQEALGGIKDIQASGKRQYFYNKFQRNNNFSANLNAKQFAIGQFPKYYLEILGIVFLTITILYFMYNEHDPKAVLSKLGLFALAAFRLLPSANRLLSAVNELSFVEPILQLISDEQKSDIQAPVRNYASLSYDQNIVFKEVYYRYPNTKKDVLKNISFTINKNKCIGIIGTSGEGKSTLADIASGLLEPTTGKIFVDGKDVQQSRKAWQKKISYVQQNIFLTDDTFRNNIAFGIQSDKIDNNKINKIIYEAQLDELVSSLPEGLDTHLGERGARLSGGQRQRIGIARALYRSTPILIFDEATSSLDNETENKILLTIKSLLGKKTLIIISHRSTALKYCDKIIEINNGEISNITNKLL